MTLQAFLAFLSNPHNWNLAPPFSCEWASTATCSYSNLAQVRYHKSNGACCFRPGTRFASDPLATIAVPTFPNCFKASSIMSSIVIDDRKAQFQIRTAKPTKTIAFPYKVQGCWCCWWWQTCPFSDHSASSFGKFGGQACLRALNIFSLSPCPPLSARRKKQPL